MNWIPACAGMTDFWSNGKSRLNIQAGGLLSRPLFILLIEIVSGKRFPQLNSYITIILIGLKQFGTFGVK
jgi:hypothetical protein